jgi:rSAM/selenodomain-associated transferase 1
MPEVDGPEAALIVIAKAPVAGRSKTRLCPPCTPAEAAALAEAALRDTLAAVAATPAARRVVALEGEPGPWLGEGFEVIAQRGEGLGARLAAAFEDVGAAALLVAMDTPQVTPALLSGALARLGQDDVDAALGATTDGGYWGIGLRRPDRAAFDGVPMSTPSTGAAQLARLKALGLRVATLDPLRDVDTIADARAVARAAPRSGFAAAMAALRAPVLEPGSGAPELEESSLVARP